MLNACPNSGHTTQCAFFVVRASPGTVVLTIMTCRYKYIMLCRIQIQGAGVSKKFLTNIISKLDEESFLKSTKKEMTEKIWLEKLRKNLEKEWKWFVFGLMQKFVEKEADR